jgi:hypothetical protein
MNIRYIVGRYLGAQNQGKKHNRWKPSILVDQNYFAEINFLFPEKRRNQNSHHSKLEDFGSFMYTPCIS